MTDDDVVGIAECPECHIIHDLHLRVFITPKGIVRRVEPTSCCAPLINPTSKCPNCGGDLSTGSILGTLAELLEDPSAGVAAH